MIFNKKEHEEKCIFSGKIPIFDFFQSDQKPLIRSNNRDCSLHQSLYHRYLYLWFILTLFQAGYFATYLSVIILYDYHVIAIIFQLCLPYISLHLGLLIKLEIPEWLEPKFKYL